MNERGKWEEPEAPPESSDWTQRQLNVHQAGPGEPTVRLCQPGAEAGQVEGSGEVLVPVVPLARLL